MRIIQLKGNEPKLSERKKVVAYARVSADYDATEHSLSQQISYYNSIKIGRAHV